MTGRKPWLAGAVVLIVVVTAVLLWRGCGRDPNARPADFVGDTVELDSPDLDLELSSVFGTANPVSTDWVCRFVCRESRGCRADVEALIAYRSNGERRTIKITGRLNGAKGEIVWLGRGQRPPEVVDRVDRVDVKVVALFNPTAPIPTPMQ